MVEFRNTPPRSSIGQRDSIELLEDLCIALRNVAVCEYSLPNGEDAQAAVQEAVSISAELDRRHVTATQRLDQLSRETGWLMNQLLVDCKLFPKGGLCVRGLDGTRRRFRCNYCKVAEHPDDDVNWGACDSCLRRIIQSFDTLEPIAGTVLFRTYNSDWRCDHADADTVLLCANIYEGLFGPGKCKHCLGGVLAKRKHGTEAR